MVDEHGNPIIRSRRLNPQMTPVKLFQDKIELAKNTPIPNDSSESEDQGDTWINEESHKASEDVILDHVRNMQKAVERHLTHKVSSAESSVPGRPKSVSLNISKAGDDQPENDQATQQQVAELEELKEYIQDVVVNLTGSSEGLIKKEKSEPRSDDSRGESKTPVKSITPLKKSSKVTFERSTKKEKSEPRSTPFSSSTKRPDKPPPRQGGQSDGFITSSDNESDDEFNDVAITTQSAIFLGNQAPKLPDMNISKKGNANSGAGICNNLVRLNEVRRDFRKFIDQTHPIETDISMGEMIINDAPELFEEYILCERALEKHRFTPLTVLEPKMHQVTRVYIKRVVGLLNASFPTALRSILPDRVWDACTGYQELVAMIFVLHRKYDVKSPQEADRVVEHLLQGAFIPGKAKNQASLEAWWEMVTKVNELRESSPAFKISNHSMAKGLRQAFNALLTNSKLEYEENFLLTQKSIDCNLDAWEVTKDNLDELYSIIYEILGKITLGSGGSGNLVKKNEACVRWTKGLCHDESKCKYKHEYIAGQSQSKNPPKPKPKAEGKPKPSPKQSPDPRSNKDCFNWLNKGSCSRMSLQACGGQKGPK